MYVSFTAYMFIIPVSYTHLFLGETITYIILLVVGLGFTLTSPLWIKNVYHRFMNCLLYTSDRLFVVDSQLEKTEINKADGIEKPGEGAQ